MSEEKPTGVSCRVPFAELLPVRGGKRGRVLRARRRGGAPGAAVRRRGAHRHARAAARRRQDVAAPGGADGGAEPARPGGRHHRRLSGPRTRAGARRPACRASRRPVPGQDPADFLGQVARDSPGGLVLILDHLEEPLADEAAAAEVASLVARVREEGEPVRFLLSIEETAFARLELIRDGGGRARGAGAAMTLARLNETQVPRFWSGRGPVGDAVRDRPGRRGRRRSVPGGALPRASTFSCARGRWWICAWRRNANIGAAAAPPCCRGLASSDVCARRAGGPRGGAAGRVRRAARSRPTTGARPPRGAIAGAEALAAAQGPRHRCGRPRPRGGVHRRPPGLREVIEDFAMADRARAAAARRALRRRVGSGERLRLPELCAVPATWAASWRRRAGAFAEPGRARDAAPGWGWRWRSLIIVAMYTDSRRAYTLGLDPRDGGGAARVVVRLGRPRWSFLNFMPNKPPLGSMVADTGYTAASLAPKRWRVSREGRVSGTLERTGPGAPAPVPTWLREVLNGLRPVQRGIAKALLGNPDGVMALKQAFSDPASRGEILSALAVMGRGGAGEDEILAGALADGTPEIRRRGVAVAAAIARRRRRDRRRPRTAAQSERGHAAPARRAGRSSRPTCAPPCCKRRRPCPRPRRPASSRWRCAIPIRRLRRRRRRRRSRSPARARRRRRARWRAVLQSSDAGARRGALVLFETIAARAPAACAPVLPARGRRRAGARGCAGRGAVDPAPDRSARARAAPAAGKGDPPRVVAAPARGGAAAVRAVGFARPRPKRSRATR